MGSQVAKFAILVTSALSLAGCDWIASFLGSTSIKVFDRCFQDGDQAGSLAVATVKAMCAERHQKTIPDVLEGKAGFGTCLPEDEIEWDARGHIVIDPKTFTPVIKNANAPRTCERFEGALTNNSAMYVVTSVTINVRHIDSTKNDSYTITNLWLEKGQAKKFSFDVSYKPIKSSASDNLNKKYRWWIESAKGFVLDY